MSGPDKSEEAEREARAGHTEAIFRAVNEEIEDLHQTFAVGNDDVVAVVCECGEMKCAEQILVLSAEYARVRADPTLFLLVPGHEDLSVEEVVESDQAYFVVRKPPGTPAEIAANAPPE